MSTFIIPFKKIRLSDLARVGGKNASLGEMMQGLSAAGVVVPDGFAVTVDAYYRFLSFNTLDKKIRELIESIKVDNVKSLRKGALAARELIMNGKFPDELSEQIISAYEKLSQQYSQDYTDVAVRSSATAEDLPDASFAGQQETFLNIRGSEGLLNAVRDCFASLFTDRAISYRENFNFDHFQIGLSVGVQKMVRSDLAASGVAFSLDTESGFENIILINGAYGLGEMVVQGSVNPDEFLVFKPTLALGKAAIIEKKMGRKKEKMIYGTNPGEATKIVKIEHSQQREFCISDEQALEIARFVSVIEKYYSQLHGKWTPMDVEWAVDGLSGKIFIVQARPETIHSQKSRDVLVDYRITDAKRSVAELFRGIAVGDKVAAGKVRIMYNLDGRDGSMDGLDFKDGEVLVTDMTDPDWEPIMKKASAIITNKGGRTCHAAIIAREMGVPAIVGSGVATKYLKNGQMVTVSCAEGDQGVVYNGKMNFEKREFSIKDLPNLRFPLMMNLASPNLAFQFAHLPNAGIGLAREEFIINNFIKIHPLALLEHRSLQDKELSNYVEELIRGYKDEETYFIKKLSYGIAKIAASVYPKPTIVRFSDFKTNEYSNMMGGKYFEPSEENPMLGWRGASRYYSKEYERAFGMECKAIARVREKMGLDNLIVMIPFCRTIEELKQVYRTMKKYGLERGKKGLEVYIMAELPANILLADEFSKLVDGFSIGSNDLTQLVLGLDRDSAHVAHIYDERNEAVKKAISNLIQSAKRNKVKVGICGQGPSDFPDFAEFLFKEGIDSISVTPDSLLKTLTILHSLEDNLGSVESPAIA